MFIDAREIPDGESIEADLCVIGAGAAGITIAGEMIGTRLRVVVLESGGLEFDEQTQSLYEGRNIGFPDDAIHRDRLRFFGGTTNHWTGHCRPGPDRLRASRVGAVQWLAHLPHSAQDLLRASAGGTWAATLSL
jgi:choline dehydrogenase-like flavoprotein